MFTRYIFFNIFNYPVYDVTQYRGCAQLVRSICLVSIIIAKRKGDGHACHGCDIYVTGMHLIPKMKSPKSFINK